MTEVRERLHKEKGIVICCMCGGVVEGDAGKRGGLPRCAQTTSQKVGPNCAAGI